MNSTDALEAARRHVALAADFLGLSPAQAQALVTAHDAAILRTDDGFTYASGETDAAGWLRSVERDRPALMGRTVKAAETTKPRDPATMTITDLMVSRDPASTAELMRRASLPTSAASALRPPAGFNITQAMSKAKAGDAAARDALAAFFGH